MRENTALLARSIAAAVPTRMSSKIEYDFEYESVVFHAKKPLVGVEPTSPDYKSGALPLSYRGINNLIYIPSIIKIYGAAKVRRYPRPFKRCEIRS